MKSVDPFESWIDGDAGAEAPAYRSLFETEIEMECLR